MKPYELYCHDSISDGNEDLSFDGYKRIPDDKEYWTKVKEFL